MLPGECIDDIKTTCTECGRDLKLQICHSGGGHYLGFWCEEDGPYSRETQYMTEAEANKWLPIALERKEIPWEITRY